MPDNNCTKQFATIFDRDAGDPDQRQDLALAWKLLMGIWFKKGPQDASSHSGWSQLICVFLDGLLNPGDKTEMFLSMKTLENVPGVSVNGDDGHHLDIVLNKSNWFNDTGGEEITRGKELNSRQTVVLKLFDTRALDEFFECEPDVNGDINTIKPKRRKDVAITKKGCDFEPPTQTKTGPKKGRAKAKIPNPIPKARKAPKVKKAPEDKRETIKQEGDKKQPPIKSIRPQQPKKEAKGKPAKPEKSSDVEPNDPPKRTTARTCNVPEQSIEVMAISAKQNHQGLLWWSGGASEGYPQVEGPAEEGLMVIPEQFLNIKPSTQPEAETLTLSGKLSTPQQSPRVRDAQGGPSGVPARVLFAAFIDR